MAQKIYQKQFSIGNILSESWKRFTENFKLIAIITLIVYVPINIVLAFFPVGDSLSKFTFYSRIANLLENLVGILATMAIAYAIKRRIDGKSVSIGEALNKSLSRWGAAILTNAILGIFLLGLTLLLIIPGIIYYVYWVFVTFIVVLNDKSGKEALDYSKSIVKGRWWTVAGYSIVFVILSLVVAIIAGFPYWFLPETFIVSAITDTFINILVSFFTVVLAIFFINFDATKKTQAKR